MSAQIIPFMPPAHRERISIIGVRTLSEAEAVELDLMARAVEAPEKAKGWLMAKADQAGREVTPPIVAYLPSASRQALPLENEEPAPPAKLINIYPLLITLQAAFWAVLFCLLLKYVHI